MKPQAFNAETMKALGKHATHISDHLEANIAMIIVQKDDDLVACLGGKQKQLKREAVRFLKMVAKDATEMAEHIEQGGVDMDSPGTQCFLKNPGDKEHKPVDLEQSPGHKWERN